MDDTMFFRNKKILIIGGTGTIGSSLVKTLLPKGVSVIRVLSRDEYKQYFMMEQMKDIKNIRFLLGDVRDYDRINRAMEDIDIVFHAAALKHVPACEYNPFEAVKTNVIGTQNVIEAAIHNNVEKVIFTSTDKTIGPTNTYGATKLLAERLISAADYYKGSHRTIFAAVRFGNVMGSRGSVIPLFKQQILQGNPITITDPEMSRFMMTLTEATNLTIEACKRAQGGELFILKMPVVRLHDLAEVVIEEMSEKYNLDPDKIRIVKTGLRPGEKMYEELMTYEESKYAIEFDNMFAVPPLFNHKTYEYSDGRQAARQTYSSHDIEPISKEELRRLILQEKLLDS
ncbi:UDP-N-acetylglucosamine 4,6-dehydratase family protein [Thermotalea metallivorans]|uniref:UDP-N-acetylglucosamine 4,6-dehydratase (Inverting) n=1 Tax=Thermotalea metallivorans TaxID=520762 RepID=A0A140L720_9FIRM|nr:UDP-N-acetylglucosamine 4,6-dehydratase family protein [Thermotalea metallivorans]KXG76345.1 UDP-N-acetylglucosamine 4,6-dehydratase (inverting) [Thermotalea metallivorans]